MLYLFLCYCATLNLIRIFHKRSNQEVVKHFTGILELWILFVRATFYSLPFQSQWWNKYLNGRNFSWLIEMLKFYWDYPFISNSFFLVLDYIYLSIIVIYTYIETKKIDLFLLRWKLCVKIGKSFQEKYFSDKPHENMRKQVYFSFFLPAKDFLQVICYWLLVPWCSGYHSYTTWFSGAWIQILHNFNSAHSTSKICDGENLW